MTDYDPLIYRGSAAHYVRGRPPYSAALASTLAREDGLDGTGSLLDVGSGPGTVAIELAHMFETVTGIDPDSDMLTVARERAPNILWIQALAEDIPSLGLGPQRLVTFGQSFQWTDRERVAETVYDLLQPGGSIAMIVHTVEDRAAPAVAPRGLPPIPHDEIREIVQRYLGPRRRSGAGFVRVPPDRYEDALGRTRFGPPRHIFAPGRPDIVRDIESVLSGYFSLSTAAPHLFGDDLDAFARDVRALLASRSETGEFWDWPGDTEIVIATKPG